MSLVLDTGWREQAACRGKPQEIFFPVPAGAVYKAKQRKADPWAPARAVCSGCPVRQECLDDALTLARAGRDVHGVWGGLDEQERRRLIGRTRPARRAS